MHKGAIKGLWGTVKIRLLPPFQNSKIPDNKWQNTILKLQSKNFDHSDILILTKRLWNRKR